MKIPYLFFILLFLNACKSDISVSNVYLNQSTATLTVGSTLDLEAIVIPEDADNKNVSWQSNKPSVASVDNGQATAITQGVAVITVTTQDGNKTADCVVTVNEKVVSVMDITLDLNEATLQAGETLLLNAAVNPDNATNAAVNWQTDNPASAKVADGLVTAITPGTAVITASSTDGSNKKAECVITVIRALLESDPIIITGYMPEYRISTSNPGDLSYLGIPNRVYFFGIYPTNAGGWQASSSITNKISIVRSFMKEGQELFVVAGGGGGATAPMHTMGNDEDKREAYAEALVSYAHQNNFDGIDIDWETNWSTSPAQKVPKDAFVDLMTRIRTKMNALPETTRVKKLTCALSIHSDSRANGLAVVHLIDQINVMVYDEYETQGGVNTHAPMSMFKTNLESYANSGIPRSKLLGGVPFYGGNRTVSPTQQKPYRDICNEAYPDLTPSMNIWNNFAFNGVDLIKEKTRYIIFDNYAGMMIWDLNQDTSYDSGLSLLRAMRQVIDESYKAGNK